MNADDFNKYFAGAQICRASRGWQHTSDDVRLRSGVTSVLTLTVTGRPTVADITVHQKDRRKYFMNKLYNAQDFKYLSVNILVLKAETCEIVSHCRYSSDRDTWVEVPAPPPDGQPKKWVDPVRAAVGGWALGGAPLVRGYAPFAAQVLKARDAHIPVCTPAR